ncbi:MAG: hypothetical protein Q8K86_09430 [Candidatus Nanopelagicaceae bacterium]|nr:hypothetical protein [Candidatus Nanopelagicaceae bacterium]
MAFYEGTNGRVAVLLPGTSYTPNHPLLYYTRQVLLAHDWSVEEVWWSSDDLDDFHRLGWAATGVIQTAKAALDKVADRNPLIVGKSLGSLALPLVSERGWPAIWLTPLLSLPELADALKTTTGKTLLIGGTVDDYWDSAIAKSSGHQVLEMPGAHHGLEISGDPVASVELLKEIVATITIFVESL